MRALTRTASEPYRGGALKATGETGIGGKDKTEQKKAGLGSPCLKLPKGQYFKNDRVSEDSSSDIEADGSQESETYTAENQWLWRDYNGKWNPYPRKINDRINKCYDRNPKSTVVVVLNKQNYRVVMAKNTQINLETRETYEVKLVNN
ncbi:uncharacterized protein LOC134245216 [Saccostrea cucullata]|uniref:uncharacterized protein LOC134245216 n=1 Tax=Saccostrea cuccullata TaxID=36930 RepID=UPI002ED2F2F4